jgi:hypothetical protein
MDTHKVNTDNANIKNDDSLSILILKDIKEMVVRISSNFIRSDPESKCCKEAIIPDSAAKQYMEPGIRFESL